MATVYGFFDRWRPEGVTGRIHNALRDQVRLGEGRDLEPTAGVIDSQLVKGSGVVGAATRYLDDMAALFVRGTWEVGGREYTGTAEVLRPISAIVMLHDGSPRTHHAVTNLRIDVDP